MDVFCLGIDYDNVGTKFGNNDVSRKGAPVVVKSGISEKIWVFFEFGPMALLRYFRRWSRIELWRQVNLPWLRDIEQ